MVDRDAYSRRGRDEWRPNERQRAVLDLLVEGKSNAEIAAALGITVDGAKWHVGELLSEVGLSDRRKLAAWWRKKTHEGRAPAWLFMALGLTKPALAVLVLGLLIVVSGALIAGGPQPSPGASTSAADPSPSPTPWPQRVEAITWQGDAAPDSCPVNQMWRLKPSTDHSLLPGIGTGDGELAWLSWAQVMPWEGPGSLRSVGWIVMSSVQSDVLVTGRLLGSSERALFSTPGNADTLTDSLVLPAPHDYHLAYVVAPSPGCWQFEVRAGGETAEIVVYLKGDQLPASCPVSSSQEVRLDIAPGIGGPHVWMATSQISPWPGSETPVRTFWLIDAVDGDVRVTGHRIDGEGTVSFVYGESAPLPSSNDDRAIVAFHNRLLEQSKTEAVFRHPLSIRDRDDQRGYLFYSSPGCYRFSVETDAGSFEIFKYMSGAEGQ